MTPDQKLLRTIAQHHDASGGAVYPAELEQTVARLERKGMLERHHLANGKRVARITDKGRQFAG
jgi:DNA-binding MarR family transcriptional regulator